MICKNSVRVAVMSMFILSLSHTVSATDDFGAEINNDLKERLCKLAQNRTMPTEDRSKKIQMVCDAMLHCAAPMPEGGRPVSDLSEDNLKCICAYILIVTDQARDFWSEHLVR